MDDDDLLITEIWHSDAIRPHLSERPDRHTLVIADGQRGRVKQALLKLGWPVEDLAGYTPGAALSFALRVRALPDGKGVNTMGLS